MRDILRDQRSFNLYLVVLPTYFCGSFFMTFYNNNIDVAIISSKQVIIFFFHFIGHPKWMMWIQILRPDRNFTRHKHIQWKEINFKNEKFQKFKFKIIYTYPFKKKSLYNTHPVPSYQILISILVSEKKSHYSTISIFHIILNSPFYHGLF